MVVFVSFVGSKVCCEIKLVMWLMEDENDCIRLRCEKCVEMLCGYCVVIGVLFICIFVICFILKRGGLVKCFNFFDILVDILKNNLDMDVIFVEWFDCFELDVIDQDSFRFLLFVDDCYEVFVW